jgi:hypothetical protein
MVRSRSGNEGDRGVLIERRLISFRRTTATRLLLYEACHRRSRSRPVSPTATAFRLLFAPLPWTETSLATTARIWQPRCWRQTVKAQHDS